MSTRVRRDECDFADGEAQFAFIVTQASRNFLR
jgi:hypothetical protein